MRTNRCDIEQRPAAGRSLIAALVMVSFLATRAFAHCDGLDGPVVRAAQRALQTGDVNQVLIWARPQDSDEIKKAFKETLAVRRLSPEAQALADRFFFETLVRFIGQVRTLPILV